MARRLRTFVVILLPFLAAAIGIGLFLRQVTAERERQHQAQYSAVLATAYRAAIDRYTLAMDTLFSETLERPEVIRLFADGARATGDARSLLRGRLYRLLHPTFLGLVQHNVRQLHFHRADGTSYLRFHQPDHADDSLIDIRPSIRIALREHRPVSGFEAGRIMSGFRFVRPLQMDGAWVGSVEISVSFKSIRDAMAALDAGREFAFVVNRHVAGGVLFESQRSLYRPSPLHPDYWMENPLIELFPAVPALSAEAQAAEAALRQDPEVQRRIAAGEAFTTTAAVEQGWLAVSFLPVRDVEGKLAAYVVAYSPTDTVASLHRDFQTHLLVAGLALLAGFGLVWRLQQQRWRLAEERSRLDTIAQTMADGLYVLDAQGRVTFVNRAACALTGYAAEELLGREIHSLIHAHARDAAVPLEECPIFRTARSGENFTGEERFIDRSGRSFPVEVSSRALPGLVGGSGAVTVFRDITVRHDADRDLRRSNADLEQFAYVVSHDLRQPLRMINSFTQLLERRLAGTLDEETAQFMTYVRDAAVRMDQMLLSLLDYARVGVKTQPPQLVDSRALLDEALLFLQPAITEAAAEIEVSGDWPAVVLCRNEGVRLFQNLIGNAIKYRAPDRPPVVEVSARSCTEGCCFSVRDNGIGIDPVQAGRLFKVFQRLATQGSYEGTGVGLAICRKIVERLGGRIWMESEGEDKGATFRFTLPLACASHTREQG